MGKVGEMRDQVIFSTTTLCLPTPRHHAPSLSHHGSDSGCGPSGQPQLSLGSSINVPSSPPGDGVTMAFTVASSQVSHQHLYVPSALITPL